WNQGGQVLGAKTVILHPNYTGSWDWDIGLVKTDKKIVFGKNVKPIKLGTKTLAGDTKASVAGWGEYDDSGNPSSTLLEAKVTVYDWKKCQSIYSEDLTQHLMCSFDKKVAPCIYDSGDPLVVKGKVYGLFAGGYGCTPNVYPVLYTDVPSLYKWIQSTIKNNQ
ncbi:trypsin-like serine protease, partial [Pseudophaeobacter profundi]|uniref:trypsin-like serine protease n=1 Tax=Pseudophaeobacter profundi TaxID=3034152 RepID=UPI00242B27FA